MRRKEEVGRGLGRGCRAMEKRGGWRGEKTK